MSAAALILHSVLLGAAVIVASFIVGWSVIKGANGVAESAGRRAAAPTAPAPLPPIHITVAAPVPAAAPAPAPAPAPVPEPQFAPEPESVPDHAEVVESGADGPPADAVEFEERAAAAAVAVGPADADTTRAIEPLPELDSMAADERTRAPEDPA